VTTKTWNPQECASKPVEEHYYSLVLAADQANVPARGDNTGAHLIVGPVHLPAYLNNQGMSIAVGANQIRTANHHFWAEPLEEAISKVLVLDISRLLDNTSPACSITWSWNAMPAGGPMRGTVACALSLTVFTRPMSQVLSAAVAIGSHR